MKVLVISNLYPPQHVGGYELCCKEAVDELVKRGHKVCVLTSSYGFENPVEDKNIYRWLEIDLVPGGSQRKGHSDDLLTRTIDLSKKEIHNFRSFRRVARTFKPDLVYLWNLTHISASVGMQARRMGLPTCYYIGDLWLSNWRNDSWLSLGTVSSPASCDEVARLAPRATRLTLKVFDLSSAPSLDLRHVQFASAYLKNETLKAGEPVADAKVVHWGVDLIKFPFKSDIGAPLRLLSVGQVVPHKGLDTAVEALGILVQRHGCTSLKLTIAGGSVYPWYVSELRQKAHLLGLDKNVELIGPVPQEQLPQLYRDHDLLLFPSLCDEGLGMSILEAMASGLVVLGTASGGSAETLIHEQTGLVFPKEDALTCAAHVLRLIKDRSLFERLRRGGRQAVEDYFELGRLMDDVECSLQSTLASRREGGRGYGQEG